MSSTQNLYLNPEYPAYQYPSSPSDSSYSSAADLTCANHIPPYDYETAIPQQNCTPPPPYISTDNFLPTVHKERYHGAPTTRIKIAHPYARLFAKTGEVKRRKIWNHALEKSLFSPYELSALGAPHRRTIYMSSLEAHIDRLHTQLLTIGFWPVAFEELEPFRGLNSKTAKSMVAGLQHDASIAKLKLLELERANEGLQNAVMHDVYRSF